MMVVYYFIISREKKKKANTAYWKQVNMVDFKRPTLQIYEGGGKGASNKTRERKLQKNSEKRTENLPSTNPHRKKKKKGKASSNSLPSYKIDKSKYCEQLHASSISPA